jgi:hypothetical protein
MHTPMIQGQHHMQYKAKDAYSSDGKKLRHIVDTLLDSFLLQPSILVNMTRYLPTRLLARSDGDRAYLGITHVAVEAAERLAMPSAVAE